MQPEDLLYTETHEWVRQEDDVLRIGITDHAVEELQDLVFLDLKDPSTRVQQGEPIGEVESVKAVADLYAPVSGTIQDVNSTVTEDLDLLLDDPYDKGWLIVLNPSNRNELDELMDAEAYGQHIAEA